MAAHAHTTLASRRLFLASGSAATVFAALGAATATEGGPIEAKFADYLDIRALADAAYSAQVYAEEGIELPELPLYAFGHDIGGWIGRDVGGGKCRLFCNVGDVNIAELREHIAQGAAAKGDDYPEVHLRKDGERAKRTLAKIEAYHAELHRVEAEVNLPALRAKAERLSSRRERAAESILAMPVTTLRGFAIQADVVLYDGDDLQCRKVLKRLRDYQPTMNI